MVDPNTTEPYWFDGNRLEFWAVAITNKYLKKAVVDKIYERGKGTKAIYRHRSNVTKEGEVHGFVKEVKRSEDGDAVHMMFSLDNITDEDKRLVNEIVGSIELAKKFGSKQHGVSVHVEYIHEAGDKDQVPLKFHLEEVTITPDPECKECRIIMEDKPMSDKIFADAILETKKNLEKDLIVKQATMEEMSAKIAEMQQTNEEILAKSKAILEENTTLKAEGKTLEDKFVADTKVLTDKVEYLEVKKPLVDEVKKYVTDAFILEMFEAMSTEKIQAWLEVKKNEKTSVPTVADPNKPMIVTKTMEATKADADDAEIDDPEFKKLEKAVMEDGLRAHGLTRELF